MKKLYYVMALLLIVVLITLGCSDNSVDVKDEAMPQDDIEMTAAELEEGKAAADSGESVEVADYQQITPEEAVEKMAGEDDVVLIDVRTQEEYDTGHIEGSLLIPLDVIAEDIETAVADKETEIIIYCRSGNRSRTAATILLELGYQNVYDLGGINDWPYDVVTE